MKLGIMQPYFAPYLGHFDLIARCDEWIVFDSAQYIRHGWVNRNRILHPTKGWQYAIVPLRKHHQSARICEVEIVSNQDWRGRIGGQLEHYRRAPFFASVSALLQETFAAESRSLCRLNVLLLQRICRYIGLPLKCRIFSEMNLALPEVGEPGEWALEISAAVGASEYLNPPGGGSLFDSGAFARRGIKLTIVDPPTFVYSCPGYTFVENLSIVDVLMWNSPAAVAEFLAASRKSAPAAPVSVLG